MYIGLWILNKTNNDKMMKKNPLFQTLREELLEPVCAAGRRKATRWK